MEKAIEKAGLRKQLSIRIAKDFEHGKTIKAIKEEYAEEYSHLFRTEIKERHIQRIISAHCSTEFLEVYNEKLTNQIVEFRKQGMKFSDIAELMGCSTCKVSLLYNSKERVAREDKLGSECITREEIESLKNSVSNGSKVRMAVKKYYTDSDCREHVRIMREEVEIKQKYPNFAETSEGCMTWSQMAIFIREERNAV